MCHGKPTGDHNRRIGEYAGLAGPEAESGEQQQGQAGNHPGHGGEGGPPQHYAGQHTPRADPVTQRTGGNFKEAVGEGEHAGDPAARLAEGDHRCVLEDVRTEAAVVKLAAAEWGTRVLDDAIQIHGAMGEALELPLSLFYRYVRHARIGGGTDEIQRMMIARSLLA